MRQKKKAEKKTQGDLQENTDYQHLNRHWGWAAEARQTHRAIQKPSETTRAAGRTWGRQDGPGAGSLRWALGKGDRRRKRLGSQGS